MQEGNFFGVNPGLYRLSRFTEDGTLINIGTFQHVIPRAEVLALKPHNANISDEWWKVATEIFGVSGSCARTFLDFEKEQQREGNIPLCPSTHENAEMWYVVHFGKAGRTSIRAANHNSDRFTEILCSKEWELKELGFFGKWFEGSGLPKKLISPVARSYLNM